MEYVKPIRDRGVYRAAANSKNVNHKWALDLVNSRGTLTGMLKWYYRDKGTVNVIRDLIYSGNPLPRFIAKEDFGGKYMPIPIRYE